VPTTPNWQAATSGSPAQAAHVNQFLGTHATTLLYAGVQRSAQTTAGTGSTSTNGTWLAQSFTTAVGQTAIGYVLIQLDPNTGLGSNLAPTTVSLYANSAGAPTGAALVSATVTAEYGFFGPINLFVPMPITGLTASTTYWIVATAAGNASFSYSWNRSNQTSGASTSANGTTWVAQTYGFLYQVFDQTASGLLQGTWEDAGARWTWRSYATPSNRITATTEYTAGQTTAGYLQSNRSYTYTNNLLTGIS
jgi:hypothetical protein